MGIFNEFFKKEKPVFTGSRFGFGSGGGGGAAAVPPMFTVTGGNATSEGGGYKYFYFTSSGSLVVAKSPSSPTSTLPIDFMLIGEGGQGQSTGGGGGGAGAFIQKMDHDLPGIPTGGTTYPVTIGNTAAPVDSRATGASSSFRGLTAPGGGGAGPSSGSAGPGGGGGSRENGTGGPPGVDPYTSIDGSGNTPT